MNQSDIKRYSQDNIQDNPSNQIQTQPAQDQPVISTVNDTHQRAYTDGNTTRMGYLYGADMSSLGLYMISCEDQLSCSSMASDARYPPACDIHSQSKLVESRSDPPSITASSRKKATTETVSDNEERLTPAIVKHVSSKDLQTGWMGGQPLDLNHTLNSSHDQADGSHGTRKHMVLPDAETYHVRTSEQSSVQGKWCKANIDVFCSPGEQTRSWASTRECCISSRQHLGQNDRDIVVYHKDPAVPCEQKSDFRSRTLPHKDSGRETLGFISTDCEHTSFSNGISGTREHRDMREKDHAMLIDKHRLRTPASPISQCSCTSSVTRHYLSESEMSTNDHIEPESVLEATKDRSNWCQRSMPSQSPALFTGSKHSNLSGHDGVTTSHCSEQGIGNTVSTDDGIVTSPVSMIEQDRRDVMFENEKQHRLRSNSISFELSESMIDRRDQFPSIRHQTLESTGLSRQETKDGNTDQQSVGHDESIARNTFEDRGRFSHLLLRRRSSSEDSSVASSVIVQIHQASDSSWESTARDGSSELSDNTVASSLDSKAGTYCGTHYVPDIRVPGQIERKAGIMGNLTKDDDSWKDFVDSHSFDIVQDEMEVTVMTLESFPREKLIANRKHNHHVFSERGGYSDNDTVVVQSITDMYTSDVYESHEDNTSQHQTTNRECTNVVDRLRTHDSHDRQIADISHNYLGLTADNVDTFAERDRRKDRSSGSGSFVEKPINLQCCVNLLRRVFCDNDQSTTTVDIQLLRDLKEILLEPLDEPASTSDTMSKPTEENRELQRGTEVDKDLAALVEDRFVFPFIEPLEPTAVQTSTRCHQSRFIQHTQLPSVITCYQKPYVARHQTVNEDVVLHGPIKLTVQAHNLINAAEHSKGQVYRKDSSLGTPSKDSVEADSCQPRWMEFEVIQLRRGDLSICFTLERENLQHKSMVSKNSTEQWTTESTVIENNVEPITYRLEHCQTRTKQDCHDEE